jgi:methylase of polypeptide subunit release factors
MPALSDLPKILHDSGYHELLQKVAPLTPADGIINLAALEVLTLEVTPANQLIRLFYMARPMPRQDVEELLTEPLCALLLGEGILSDAGEGELRAACAMVPARGFWGLRDFDGWATGKPRSSDHVLGVGVASALLADLTVRRQGERVLDLGTGQGFQAALASQHASSVVATDINVRALHLARLAMRMNNLGRIEFREGSFFEPVQHESFDLVVSNPPFVIAPPHDLSAIGGRWIGDSFVETLVSRTPEFLREGGWATLLCNWHHPSSDDWLTRPATWMQNRGVDAWVVKFQTEQPEAYAENWLRESAGAEGESALAAAREKLPHWLDYYRSLNVGAISTGVVFLRRRTLEAGDPPHWLRGDAIALEEFSGQAGAQAQRLFAGETLLRGLPSEDALLDRALQTSPDSELAQRLHPRDRQWMTVESALRQTQGFQFPIQLGPVPAAILARLDGTRPARAVIQELAAEMNANPSLACAQAAPFLARMVRMTHVAVE